MAQHAFLSSDWAFFKYEHEELAFEHQKKKRGGGSEEDCQIGLVWFCKALKYAVSILI